jgi:hypothetical protein
MNLIRRYDMLAHCWLVGYFNKWHFVVLAKEPV